VLYAPKPERNHPAHLLSYPSGKRSLTRVRLTSGLYKYAPVKHIRYLLIFIDTLIGWIEAFPTTNKRASTVVTILFREIIPHFGLPISLQSDNGPEFTSTIVQQLTSYIGSKWHFHNPYDPQSSGKVEKANHTLKKHTHQTYLGTSTRQN
jgi:transposase InsO family protein